MLLVALYALVTAVPVGAQQNPSTCAESTRGNLAGYEGTWTVHAEFRNSDGSWEPTNATATIAPELAGCLLREEYHGERSGRPYDYVALWGGNGLDDSPYQRVFAHSQHGIMVLREGGLAGDTLVLQSNVVVRGERVTEEDRITRPDSARFTLTNRRSSDDGLTWTVTRRATYNRVSSRE